MESDGIIANVSSSGDSMVVKMDTSRRTIKCKRGEVKSKVDEVLKSVSKDLSLSYAKLLKKNIILQLQTMHSKTLDPKLREEIIQSITKITSNSTGNGYTFSINHPLAKALDIGTGIHGPNHTMIVKLDGFFKIPLENTTMSRVTYGKNQIHSTRRSIQGIVNRKQANPLSSRDITPSVARAEVLRHTRKDGE